MMRVLLTLIFIGCYHCYSQTAIHPKYAPRSEKHKNITDEIGRKQGTWKYYNESGAITLEVNYQDDIKHGLLKRYYAGGRIMRESEFEYGLREGFYKRYYPNGQLRQEGSYSGGKRTDAWTAWFSSGNIQSEGMYVNGVKEGEWKYYNQKGQLINTISFIKGKDQREIIAAEKKTAAEKLKRQKAKKNPGVKIRVTPSKSDSLRL
jgi:antitoxin component YwqK of YwqJK toxin-antitoxin module